MGIAFAPKLSKKYRNLLKNNSLDLNKNLKQVFAYSYIMNKLIDYKCQHKYGSSVFIFRHICNLK